MIPEAETAKVWLNEKSPEGNFARTVDDLELLYGYWGEAPGCPVEDWKYEVANNDSRRGYWSWAFNRLADEV